MSMLDMSAENPLLHQPLTCESYEQFMPHLRHYDPIGIQRVRRMNTPDPLYEIMVAGPIDNERFESTTVFSGYYPDVKGDKAGIIPNIRTFFCATTHRFVLGEELNSVAEVHDWMQRHTFELSLDWIEESGQRDTLMSFAVEPIPETPEVLTHIYLIDVKPLQSLSIAGVFQQIERIRRQHRLAKAFIIRNLVNLDDDSLL